MAGTYTPRLCQRFVVRDRGEEGISALALSGKSGSLTVMTKKAKT